MINKLNEKYPNIKPISEYGDVICGPFGSEITNSDYLEHGVPLIRITNLNKDGVFDTSDLVFISEELSSRLKSTQVATNDIVISQRGTLGQCAVVTSAYDKCNISANIIAVKNIKGISAEFLKNYIISSLGTKLLSRTQSGQVQGKITTEDIASLLVPVTSLEHDLNVMLKSAYISKQEKLAMADALLAGMDDYAMTVLGLEAPKVKSTLCSVVRLGDMKKDNKISAEYYHPERLATLKMVQTHPVLRSRFLKEIVSFERNVVIAGETNTKYLGLAGVQSNTGELTGIDESAEGQAFLYRKGDVLYSKLRPYLNKVHFAERDGICSTEFHVMRINSETVLPEYLSVILRSSLILSQTKHMMTGNTHPRLSDDDVKNLLIPIPDIDTVQPRIAAEAYRRCMEGRRLREEAESEWETAKKQFEIRLLEN